MAANVFKNRAWDWDVDCWHRSVGTEMGIDMDDPIHVLRIATEWQKQVIESMVKAYEANDVRVLNFEASLAAPWYSFDAQGMYDPKASFLRFTFEQAPMEVGVHTVGFIKV